MYKMQIKKASSFQAHMAYKQKIGQDQMAKKLSRNSRELTMIWMSTRPVGHKIKNLNELKQTNQRITRKT